MQVPTTAALTNTATAPAAAEAPASPNDATAPGAPSTAAPLPAVTVSLSDAAQAYLSQPDSPSVAEIQRAKKKPKFKTLLEHMLEWSRKYEEQQEAQQKDKQRAVNQGAAIAAPVNKTAKKPVD